MRRTLNMKRFTIKRILSLFLSVVMVVLSLSVGIAATDILSDAEEDTALETVTQATKNIIANNNYDTIETTYNPSDGDSLWEAQTTFQDS